MLHRSPDHVVLAFNGPDAQTFLQSQLTNDVGRLAVGAWQWQGYCSAKGRLYATFALCRLDTEQFLAIVHHSVVAALAKRLTMFRLRSKLDIQIRTDLAVQLQLGENLPLDAGTEGALIRLDLGNGRTVRIQPATATSLSSADPAFMAAWNLAGIQARQPEVTAATSEMFVPQMIGWDTVQPGGGVDFGKGCYPGQEIVARAHYRGAVKRHIEQVVLNLDSNGVSEGSEVKLPDGRIGEICNMARRSDGEAQVLLVVQPHSD